MRSLKNDNETLLKEVKILRYENEVLYRKLEDKLRNCKWTVGTQSVAGRINLCPNHNNEEEKISASPLRHAGSTKNAISRKMKGSSDQECPFDNHGSILSLHLVHHGGKRLRIKERWIP